MDLRRGTSPKEGIRAVAGVTTTTMIGETVTMGEVEAVEGGGEGDEVVIMEVGMIDHRTGIGIGMNGNLSLLDGICGTDEVDQGVHQGVPDVRTFHGGTNESGVLPVWTHANLRCHSQLL